MSAFTVEDVHIKILGIITDEGNQRIPDEDAKQIGNFDEFITELRELADGQAGKVFDMKLFVKVGEKYDAEISALAKRVGIYAGDGAGLKMTDLLGDCRHVHPFYMFYDLAMTKLVNMILLKLFHSYVKKELYPNLRSRLIKIDDERNSIDPLTSKSLKEAALKLT